MYRLPSNIVLVDEPGGDGGGRGRQPPIRRRTTPLRTHAARWRKSALRNTKKRDAELGAGRARMWPAASRGTSRSAVKHLPAAGVCCRWGDICARAALVRIL